MTQSEVAVPTDMLASLLMEQVKPPSSSRDADRLPARVFGIMAVTTLLTFGTLVTGYQLLFPHQLFA